MSNLLALSLDGVSAPRIMLKAPEAEPAAATAPSPSYGWGFGWYPGTERFAEVVKDYTLGSSSQLMQSLAQWERFASTLFIGHLRGAAERILLSDTQPFARSLGGRTWVFAHNGDLRDDWRQRLPLGDHPSFEPMGHSDSEHCFCWLLGRLQEAGARSLAEVDWNHLHSLFAHMNALGSLNLMLSDGQYVAVYRDKDGFNGLWWTRLRPPHDALRLENAVLSLNLDGQGDRQRSLVLFSTAPLSDAGWQPMEPGQLLLASRGALRWNSAEPEPQRLRRPPAPAPQWPSRQANLPAPLGVQPIASSATPVPQETAPADPQHRRPAILLHSKPPEEQHSLLRVVHETRYAYDSPVERSHHVLRLRPVQDEFQAVLEHELSFSVNGAYATYEDVFGNQTLEMEVNEPYTAFDVRATSLVRVRAKSALDLRSVHKREQIPLVWMPWQRQMMLPYLLPMELPENHLRELSDFAMSFVERNDYDLLDTLVDINRTIYQDFSYVPGTTTLETTPFEVYISRGGVCQDFANLMVCMARLLGVPARYRVGYIDTHADYENTIQSDASHAWVELYLPRLGWRGFDPTNGGLTAFEHVRVACGRNFRDATPTAGTLFRGGGGEQLSVAVRVECLKPASHAS